MVRCHSQCGFLSSDSNDPPDSAFIGTSLAMDSFKDEFGLTTLSADAFRTETSNVSSTGWSCFGPKLSSRHRSSGDVLLNFFLCPCSRLLLAISPLLSCEPLCFLRSEAGPATDPKGPTLMWLPILTVVLFSVSLEATISDVGTPCKLQLLWLFLVQP